MNIWLYLLVSLGFYTGGEVFSKLWATQPRLWLLPCVYGSYMAGVTCWLLALRQRNELAVLGALWAVTATVVSISLGLVVFREPLRAAQYAGLALALTAIWLLS